ncbi:MAG: tetratricopeptide repeat protein [Segatella copri]
MKREDFCWTKFSHEHVTTISRIEAIRKIIDQEVGLESCQPGIAEIEKRYDNLYHDYIDGKLKHRELYNLAQTLDLDTDNFFGKVRHAWILANEPTFVALNKRALKLTSFDEVQETFEKFATDEAMLNLKVGFSEEQIDEERQKIQEQLNAYRNMVFSYIMVTDDWNEDFILAIRSIIDSDLVDPYTINMIVSAVSLSCSVFMVPEKIGLLLRLFKSAGSCSVRERAFVGFVFSVITNPAESDACWRAAAATVTDDVLLAACVDLQRQMRLCLTSKKDSKEMMHSVVKTMFSTFTQDLAEKLKDRGKVGLDEFTADGEDPEEAIQGAFNYMLNSEDIGVDVYYHQFANQKCFGHFHSLYNWFVPFYVRNSTLKSVRGVMNQHRNFVNNLLKGASMCDTDLYSVILSLNNTSKEFIKSLDVAPENMVSGPVFYDEEEEVEKEQNTEESVEDETDSTEAKDSENVTLLDSVMEHEENLSEEKKKKRAIRVRHRYVQDLYRFYTLSPMRKAFDNPFEVQKEIPFMTTGLFAKPEYDKYRLSLARFSAKRGDFAFVSRILRNLSQYTEEEQMMLALAYYSEKNYSDALDYVCDILEVNSKYKAAYELKLKIEEKCEDENAFSTLDEIIKLETDKDKQFKLQLKKIDLSLKFHRFNEALQLAFLLDEQHPKEEQIECRLAFSLLFTDSEGDKNIDRAMALIEPYIQKCQEDEMKKLLQADLKDIDQEHVEQMFMKMLSTMMKKVSHSVDHRWESMKYFYYGLCILVKEGGAVAVSYFDEAANYAACFGGDVDEYGLLEMGEWLDKRGIAPIELEFMTKKVTEERKNNKDGGE